MRQRGRRGAKASEASLSFPPFPLPPRRPTPKPVRVGRLVDLLQTKNNASSLRSTPLQQARSGLSFDAKVFTTQRWLPGARPANGPAALLALVLKPKTRAFWRSPAF